MRAWATATATATVVRAVRHAHRARDARGGDARRALRDSRRRRNHHHIRCAASSNDDTRATTRALTDAQRAQMRAYAELLMRENKGEHGMLTGATSVEEVLEAHVGDALALTRAFDALLHDDDDDGGGGSGVRRVMDVGSGAGFPGIPLAIARPQWRFTLLDTLRKRTTFLEVVARELGLTNVDVVWARAEDLAREDAHREQYDLVTARAVAELRTLAEFCVPFVKVGGYWAAPKNADVENEIADAANAVSLLGAGAMRVEAVDSIGPDGRHRTVVISRKENATNEKYPRKAGKAKKRPL